MVKLLLVLLLALAAPARAETAWPPEARLTVIPDPMSAPPMAGEMILATLRGEYIGNVALERLAVPPFEDFSWLQLSPPAWSDEMIGNRMTRVFEQRLAFFPQRSGSLIIGPIRHELTFAGPGAERLRIDAASPPVTLDIRPRPDTGRSWWLPARALTVTDEWDPEPDSLAPDQWTRRTVTLEVTGLPPQALPPPPQMAAGGLFSFIDPEERSVRLTPDGPVSTVIWHYRMQPQSDAPADLDDIPIAWFDTGARLHREVMLAGREIAFAASALPKEPGPLARHGIELGAAAGLLVGAALLLPGVGTLRGPALGRLRKRIAGLRLAARLRLMEARGDLPRMRETLLDYLRLKGIDPGASPTLRLLDRHLFGPTPDRLPPGLTRRARAEARDTTRPSPV